MISTGLTTADRIESSKGQMRGVLDDRRILGIDTWRVGRIHYLDAVLVENREPQIGDPALTPKQRSTWRRLGRVQDHPQVRRSRSLLLATVVVTLLFSYIALSDINMSLAWRALRTSDLWWIAAALIPFGLGNIARALRWHSLFARGRRPPSGAVTNAIMVGYLYNNMPARVGEAARVVVLTQRSSAPPVEIVGTVLVERLYDVLTILVIFFAAEPWLPHVSWFDAAAVVALVLAALLIAGATMLAVYGDRPLRVLLRPLRRLCCSPVSAWSTRSQSSRTVSAVCVTSGSRWKPSRGRSPRGC